MTGSSTVVLLEIKPVVAHRSGALAPSGKFICVEACSRNGGRGKTIRQTIVWVRCTTWSSWHTCIYPLIPLIAWWIFPVRDVSHYQRVFSGFSAFYFSMGTSAISMVIFNSELVNYQREYYTIDIARGIKRPT